MAARNAHYPQAEETLLAPCVDNRLVSIFEGFKVPIRGSRSPFDFCRVNRSYERLTYQNSCLGQFVPAQADAMLVYVVKAVATDMIAFVDDQRLEAKIFRGTLSNDTPRQPTSDDDQVIIGFEAVHPGGYL
eukprot:917827-Prorocentrum_minimum.AAC.1